jgi:hypothetical protein
MPVIFALAAGTFFGAGLAVSDMVNPARVLNFFDIAGNWDPTLLFVMGGALLSTFVGYRIVFRRDRPFAAEAFHLPSRKTINLPLLAGAVIFGIGWGLAGFCPGPAIAALVSLQPKVWLFVASMTAATFVTGMFMRSRS